MSKELLKARNSPKSFVRTEGQTKEREAESLYRVKPIRLYSKYFTGVKDMFGLFLDFDLTKLEHDIANMLINTIESNNLLFYSENDYVETLGINNVSLRKGMAKLSKLNVFKRLYRRDGYTVLRLNPHILWMGDPETGEKLQNEFPPINSQASEERKRLVSRHESWTLKIHEMEKKLINESLHARAHKSTVTKRRIKEPRGNVPQQDGQYH